MMKRSLAILCCLLWSFVSPVLAEDASSLLVRVTDGKGRPVSGATVRAMPESIGENGRPVPSDPAAGGETVEVELRFQEGAAVAGRVTGPEGRPEREERVEVRGRVLGPDGAAVEGARVSSPDQSVHSARNGSFTLQIVRGPGPHVILARKPGEP